MNLSPHLINRRVLTVDDNPTIHEDFRKILEKSVAADNRLEDLESAVLEAERHWPSPEENVSITLRARESPFLQHEVLAFPARGFRTLLARLNHAYLADQLYGGCVQRVLVQGGRRNVVTMHTGNDSVSGLWLRVTSSVSLPEPGR